MSNNNPKHAGTFIMLEAAKENAEKISDEQKEAARLEKIKQHEDALRDKMLEGVE